MSWGLFMCVRDVVDIVRVAPVAGEVVVDGDEPFVLVVAPVVADDLGLPGNRVAALPGADGWRVAVWQGGIVGADPGFVSRDGRGCAWGCLFALALEVVVVGLFVLVGWLLLWKGGVL